MNPQTGYIILWQGHTWLSKAIRQIMAYWNWVRGKQQGFSFSHAATMYDKVTEGEAISLRYKLTSFSEEYQNKKGWVMIGPIIPMTEEQIRATKEMITKLEREVKVYQFWNFLQWPVYVATFGGVNLFGKGGIKAVYCYEAAARIVNAAYPGTFKYPEIMDSYSLWTLLDTGWEIKIDNR